MVSCVDGYVAEIKTGAHLCDPEKTLKTHIMEHESDSPKRNIKSPVTVNPDDIADAERIEQDANAMLRLIDILFFLRDDDDPPS